MSLRTAYIGTRVLETTQNYAVADAPLATAPEARTSAQQRAWFDDEEFWQQILAAPERYWGVLFETPSPVAVSEWVARVPGLFWKPEVRYLREYRDPAVEFIGRWRAYSPASKSGKVIGGVGTLRLPPADDGKRLISLTGGLNASAGIPVLVFPEVWDKINARGPAEGRMLRIIEGVRWQAMSSAWSAHFQATRNMPRGYLVLSDPDTIEVTDEVAPVLIHPFSVMEYREGAKELFAYVYASADASESDFRSPLEAFFAEYARAKDRYGRYLLAGDMLNPMWDAVYDTPADLRRADPGSDSQLALVEARVREQMLGSDTLDRVLEALGRLERVDLQRISSDVGIASAAWDRSGTQAESASQFVDETQRQEKMEELIEVLAGRFPTLIAD